MTNRRVNALEFVVIPRFALIIAFIIQELDELDREDFVRIKKTQDVKKKKKIAEAVLAAKGKEKNAGEKREEQVIEEQTKFEEEEEDDDVFV